MRNGLFSERARTTTASKAVEEYAPLTMKTIDFTVPRGAIFSDDRVYRYVLWRVWNLGRPLRLQIGLNPSSTNEISDDPTITRGIGKAAKDGFGGFLMANLYGYVSTNPDILLEDGEFIGIDNDTYLRYLIRISDQVICGWGSFPAVIKRAPTVLRMIPNPYCLGVNRDGQPKHPLYVGYNMPVIPYTR